MLPPDAKLSEEDSALSYGPGTGGNWYTFFDHRAIRVNRKIVVTRDIRKMVDPASPAYSRIMALAVIADHPEIGDPLRTVDYLRKYRPKELEKYQKYIDESEAYLAATYHRSIETEAEARAGEFRRRSSFLSPDFTEMPELSIVFIPPAFRRYAAYTGIHNTLFDFNLMGIGDRELTLPDEVGW